MNTKQLGMIGFCYVFNYYTGELRFRKMVTITYHDQYPVKENMTYFSQLNEDHDGLSTGNHSPILDIDNSQWILRHDYTDVISETCVRIPIPQKMLPSVILNQMLKHLNTP